MTYGGDFAHVVFLDRAAEILLDGFFEHGRALVVRQLKDLFDFIPDVLGLSLGMAKGELNGRTKINHRVDDDDNRANGTYDNNREEQLGLQIVGVGHLAYAVQRVQRIDARLGVERIVRANQLGWTRDLVEILELAALLQLPLGLFGQSTQKTDNRSFSTWKTFPRDISSRLHDKL